MSTHHTFHLRMVNAHGVLPRILLVFSRRRLRVEAMQFYDVGERRHAEVRIDLACEPRVAHEVERQIRRIVEVVAVRAQRLRERPETTEASAPLALAV